MAFDLDDHTFHNGYITGFGNENRRLVLPRADGREYSLAQMDDYAPYWRPGFPHKAPVTISLEARASGTDLPGTWGFGLWNDPFSVGLLAGGVARILPVLPNAAWFFFASQDNFLSLYDDLPGSGFMARTYRSPLLPGVFSLLTLFLFPLVVRKGGRRFLRKMARHFVKEAGVNVEIDVCEWHTYSLDWYKDEVIFFVDETEVFRTALSPRGNLGFAIWMDNQYFRFDATGKMEFGFLSVPENQYLEIRTLYISSKANRA